VAMPLLRPEGVEDTTRFGRYPKEVP